MKNNTKTNLYWQKIKALFSSVRITTRVWYDIVIPVTILILVRNNEASLFRYIAAVAAVIAFHAGHTYFNDVTDLEVDRQSTEPGRRQRALVLGKISPREMTVAGWGLIIISIILTFSLPWQCLIIAAIAVPLVLAYNFEPFHLSARPLATQIFWPITWVLMFFFCVIAIESNHWLRAIPYLVFVVLFMGLGESLGQDIRDADNDLAGGRKTTVVRYGVPRTTIFAWAAQVGALFAWIWLIISYPLPILSGILALLIIFIWLIYFGVISLRLQKSYHKTDARMTHIGSIITFTLVNIITINGILFQL